MREAMNELTERQETILALIVHEYTDSARPVGSNRLVKRYELNLSSATVRNEMAALTDAELLRQPHTSAGRIPTEEGYRYFVRRLQKETDLPPQEKRLISHQFHQARGDIMEEWVRLAASVLAQHSKSASLVTAPHPEKAAFKHLELIETRGYQALLVLVLEGGEIRQQVLALAKPIGQEKLSETAHRITRACLGKNADGVADQAADFSALGQEVVRLIEETMRRADDLSAGEVYRDGLAYVLREPEFAQSDSALRALRLLEERSFLEEVLAKVLSPSVGEGVQVVIGGEGAWEELRDCSVVLARYGAAGYATGALGVLGPTRMAYGRTISAVRYVAGLMSDLVVEAFAA
jgi:heat-inducible transcriptional repressor